MTAFLFDDGVRTPYIPLARSRFSQTSQRATFGGQGGDVQTKHALNPFYRQKVKQAGPLLGGKQVQGNRPGEGRWLGAGGGRPGDGEATPSHLGSFGRSLFPCLCPIQHNLPQRSQDPKLRLALVWCSGMSGVGGSLI